MGYKIFSVNLDADRVLLAKVAGLENLSEFFRECLDEYLYKSSIIERPEKNGIPADLISGIVSEHKERIEKSRSEVKTKKEIESEKKKRVEVMENVFKEIFQRYPTLGRWLPSRDRDCMYDQELSKVLSEASNMAGFTMESYDIEDLYQRLNGGKK